MEGIDPQDKDKLSEVSSDSFDRISDTSSVKSFRELNDYIVLQKSTYMNISEYRAKAVQTDDWYCSRCKSTQEEIRYITDNYLKETYTNETKLRELVKFSQEMQRENSVLKYLLYKQSHSQQDSSSTSTKQSPSKQVYQYQANIYKNMCILIKMVARNNTTVNYLIAKSKNNQKREDNKTYEGIKDSNDCYYWSEIVAWDLQIKAIESKIKMIEEYQNNEVTPIKNLRLERMNVGSEAAMKPISEPIYSSYPYKKYHEPKLIEQKPFSKKPQGTKTGRAKQNQEKKGYVLDPFQSVLAKASKFMNRWLPS